MFSNPTLERQRKRQRQEEIEIYGFEASLVYTPSSKPSKSYTVTCHFKRISL